MRKVSRNAIVPYTARQMFTLVDDIEAYPDFLPWCEATIIHERHADSVEASIELRKGALKKQFRTRNTNHAYKTIDMALVDGPFRTLDGGWRFDDLGKSGCKVSLDLEFELQGRLMDAMLGPFFEEICNRLVDAFTRRAREIYANG